MRRWTSSACVSRSAAIAIRDDRGAPPRRRHRALGGGPGHGRGRLRGGPGGEAFRPGGGRPVDRRNFDLPGARFALQGTSASARGTTTTKRPAGWRSFRTRRPSSRRSSSKQRPTGSARSICPRRSRRIARRWRFEGRLGRSPISRPSTTSPGSAWTLNRAGRRDEAQSLAIEARAQLVRLGLTAHSLARHARQPSGGETGDRRKAHRCGAAPHDGGRDGRSRPSQAARRVRATGLPARRLRASRPRGLVARPVRRSVDALERARAPSHVDFTTLAGWSRRDPVSWHAWRRIQRRAEGSQAAIARRDVARRALDVVDRSAVGVRPKASRARLRSGASVSR